MNAIYKVIKVYFVDVSDKDDPFLKLAFASAEMFLPNITDAEKVLERILVILLSTAREFVTRIG